MNIEIHKPRKYCVPVNEALHWKANGSFIYTRKYDGEFVSGGVAFSSHVLVAERIKFKSGGKFTHSDLGCLTRSQSKPRSAWFYAVHSVAVLYGQNVLSEKASVRWLETCRLLQSGAHFAHDGAQILLADSGSGGDFLAAVLRDGGEGVCAVPANAPWGYIYAAKGFIEVYPRVTGKDAARGTLAIADAVTGEPLGVLPCRAHFDTVKVGNIIEVHCLERHHSGKLREAKFVSIRTDKN